MTKTYTQFTQEHAGKYFWSCDAGADEYGRKLLDVLVYDTEEDMDKDDDNSLAIARATVIDDRGLWALRAREVLELIAAPMRPDGTWNRDREACRQMAAEVLGRHED